MSPSQPFWENLVSVCVETSTKRDISLQTETSLSSCSREQLLSLRDDLGAPHDLRLFEFHLRRIPGQAIQE